MRLIELRANQDSFKNIRFNETGVSIIAALKVSQDRQKTFNSVGKSLSVSLIHFCLGSDAKPEFSEKLTDWVFTLEFKVGNENYIAERSTAQQDIIVLNGEEQKLKDFRNILQDKLFRVPSGSKFVSFRGLISRFIRPNKHSYARYYKYSENEGKSIAQDVNNALLLGLDIKRIFNKVNLKKQIEDLDNKRKSIEKDEILTSFFKTEEKSDLDIEINDLEERIGLLQNNIDNFIIAEDYAKIKQEADEISATLKQEKNRRTKYQTALSNIEKSLDIQPDISNLKVKRMYQEAQIQLPDLVVKKLDELEDFHKKLLSNRSRSLVKDRKRFEEELENLNGIIKSLTRKEDEKLQYLNAHGALEEYSSLNRQLADTEKKLHRLQQYKQLKAEYTKKLGEFQKKLIDENQATEDYLTDIKDVVNNNITTFKNLVKLFYKEKKGGITILNNTGSNKKRFNIEAKISDDGGDGVNEVKTFCWDWTILQNQFNHSVKFIYHDSRLLDGMDPRQVRTLLNIVNSDSQTGFQYIISMNQNVIDSLKKEMSETEFTSNIEEKIVLKLSDESDEKKLLGIQVDLQHDK